VDFSRQAIVSAERGIERLHNTVRALRTRIQNAIPAGTADLSYITELDPYREAFIEAMDDDFNTPRAIAVLFDFSKQVNTLLASGQPLGRGTLSAMDSLYRELGGKVLGIIPNDLGDEISSEVIEGLMRIILDIRQEYRQAREWERADALRDRLAALGIAVEDRPEGPTWRMEH